MTGIWRICCVLRQTPRQSGRNQTQLGIISSRSREQQASMSWPGGRQNYATKIKPCLQRDKQGCGNVALCRRTTAGVVAMGTPGWEFPVGYSFSRGSGIWGKGAEEWLNSLGLAAPGDWRCKLQVWGSSVGKHPCQIAQEGARNKGGL